MCFLLLYLFLLIKKENHENVLIRTCVTEDMNSQCGSFTFRNDSVRGCMLTCDTDLCNAASTLGVPPMRWFTGLENNMFITLAPVSYTHLTLPTKA